MSFLAKVLAGAAAATLLAIAAPLSASATPAYTPHRPDSWARTIVPQTSVRHTIPNETFDPCAALQVSVTSESPSPTLATFAASQLTGALTSDCHGGGAVVKLDFGADTHGVYDVTVSQPGTDRVSYGVVTVIPAKSAAAVAADPADPSSLARTGTTIDMGVLWGAGAAIAAGIVLWVLSRVRRRTR
ncbi:hypothetical protein GCM10022286_30270 [Gryllotalpicola daejeonensis]|uniref:Uncharacterized protein n=1 Tax=Gryllotalpicola daejeonensis TaxID=993087 RepID=A0ABP7ZNN1_9MICO